MLPPARSGSPTPRSTSTPRRFRIVGATSVESTKPPSRVLSDVRLPSKPRPAIPIASAWSFASGGRSMAISRSSPCSPRTSARTCCRLADRTARVLCWEPGGGLRLTFSVRRLPPSEIRAPKKYKTLRPHPAPNTLQRPAAYPHPDAGGFERRGQQARDDVGGRGLGPHLHSSPPSSTAAARRETGQLGVVEGIEDPVALRDVEVGLLSRNLPQPGAQQSGRKTTIGELLDPGSSREPRQRDAGAPISLAAHGRRGMGRGACVQ